jgi:hypothetical protein
MRASRARSRLDEPSSLARTGMRDRPRARDADSMGMEFSNGGRTRDTDVVSPSFEG